MFDLDGMGSMTELLTKKQGKRRQLPGQGREGVTKVRTEDLSVGLL